MIDRLATERYRAVKRLVDDLQAWPSADTLRRLTTEAEAGKTLCTALTPGFDKVRAVAGQLLVRGAKPDPLWAALFAAVDDLDTRASLGFSKEPSPA